ncbi:hypothetical protein QE152_g19560 [Popillia japonica]|uniref:Uncharacterized protein n=1 Tax=Popillia japonica TaxID=7064 RepID=A0AAW1KRR2_POPJA
MSGISTRSQKQKTLKAKSITPNTSYISVITSNDKEGNEECGLLTELRDKLAAITSNDKEENEECGLLTELRDKLAAANYTVGELYEKIDEKDKLIAYYRDRYENQKAITENLHKAIHELSSRMTTTVSVSDAQTQTCLSSPVLHISSNAHTEKEDKLGTVSVNSEIKHANASQFRSEEITSQISEPESNDFPNDITTCQCITIPIRGDNLSDI